MGNKIILFQDNKETEVNDIAGLKVEWLGKNGILKIHAPFNFSNSTIQISDSGVVEIFENSHIRNLFLRCAAEDSTVTFGKHFGIESGQIILPRGHVNQSLTIGEDCLFSSNIFIQTADDHTILDMDGNVLNNNGGHVSIGDHVWLGHGVSVLKKASIASDTIVAESSVVSKAFSRRNCILGGVPAKIIKINVNWSIKAPEIYLRENSTNG